MWTLRASSVVGVSLVAIVLSLSSPGALTAAPAAPQDALHQVLPGDDLHLLAGYYYGDARQWERIWQANRDQVKDPNRIRRGALLRIPDATPPEEPYADFLARTRRAQPPAARAPGPAGPPSVPAAVTPLPGGASQPPPSQRP